MAMIKKILSLSLAACFLCSTYTITHAEDGTKPKEITLSMASNKTQKTSIDGLYVNSDFYITAEDLCVLIGGKLESTTKEKVEISMNSGQRFFTFDINGKMFEELPFSRYEVAISSMEYEGKYYISALQFLNYAGVTVQIDKDADTQFKVFKRYDIFDALVDYKAKNLGYYFWWDEVDTGKEKIKDKLLNAGVVTLINKNSNIFRMMVDAKGIEKEALEDTLLSIVTNEGQNSVDTKDLSGDISNSSDMLGLGSDLIDLITDAYDSDSTELMKDFKLKIGTVADTASVIDKALQAYESLSQFDTISNTQKNLLQDTILSHSKDSKTLCDGWDVVYDAAKNLDQQIQKEYDKYYKVAMKNVQSEGYGLLSKAVSGPISIAWDGIITLTNNIPYTKDLIDKKEKLYHSYNSSMIQVIANEMMVEAYSDWYYGNQKDTKTQEQNLYSVKQLLILQLKATLTTREYLLDSGFLSSDYASEMKNTNKRLGQFLNQVENCKITGPGFFSNDTESDLSWMATYESRYTPEQAETAWKEFIESSEYLKYTEKWEKFWNAPLKYEYAIKDLNADTIPECIITRPDTEPFFHTAIFTFDKKQITQVFDQYGYGKIRYVPSKNMIIGIPEIKSSVDYSYAPFYSLKDTKLINEFTISRETGVSYYSANGSKTVISDEERQSYYADAEDLEWMPIP